MAPFDRQYMTFYFSAIVDTALSCRVFELFTVEGYRDLEIWVSSPCLESAADRLETLASFKSKLKSFLFHVLTLKTLYQL